jgi:hypothetical protein
LERELSLAVGSKSRGSAGESSGFFVAPNIVEELALQHFDPTSEPHGGYLHVERWPPR